MRWCVFLLFALVANSAEPELKNENNLSPPITWELQPLEAGAATNEGVKLEVGDSVTYQFLLPFAAAGIADKKALQNLQVREQKKTGEAETDKLNYQLEWVEDSRSSENTATQGKGLLKITPLVAGTLTVPALELLDQEGKVLALSQPFVLEVKSNFGEKEKKEPTDYISPQDVHFPFIWFFVLSAVLLLLFVYSLVLFAKATAVNKGLALGTGGMVPLLDPAREALQSIDRLETDAPWKQQQWKRFGFEISHILKRYLARSGVEGAEEATTAELFRDLIAPESQRYLEWDGKKVSELLSKLDWVKFSDVPSTPEECISNLNWVRDWVTRTGQKYLAPPVVVADSGSEGQTSGEKSVDGKQKEKLRGTP